MAKPGWQRREEYIEKIGERTGKERGPAEMWPRVVECLTGIGGRFHPDTGMWVCDHAIHGEFAAACERFVQFRHSTRTAREAMMWGLWGDAEWVVISIPRNQVMTFAGRAIRVRTLADVVAITTAEIRWRQLWESPPTQSRSLEGVRPIDIIGKCGDGIDPADVFDGPLVSGVELTSDGNFSIWCCATSTTFYGLRFGTS